MRAGDLVAFPVGAGGAHRLENRSEHDALVVMLSNYDPADVCFYPDSRKHVVDAADVLVRDHPQLDYYDGETEPAPALHDGSVREASA